MPLDLGDDAAGRWHLSPRRTRWSEATEDIAAFRKVALDGNLSITPASRTIASLGMAEARVASDDQGSTRIVKDRGKVSRDDVAGTLAAGELARPVRRRQVGVRKGLDDNVG